jgi:squalene cyclase
MISSFETILALKKLMLLMEVDLGIDALSDDAKTLLVAISDVQNSDGSFISYAARNHELTKQMPHASYHRALKALIDNKFIKLHPENKKSHYVLIAKNT